MGLWTNNKTIVETIRIFFERLWSDAIPINARILEIETGKPISETIIIKEASVAYTKFHDIADVVKEELIGLTSSKSINRILETYPYREAFKRGVKLRFLTPFTSDNLEARNKLNKYAEIKHIEASYIRILIVDKKHLFLFKTPPSEEEPTDPLAYFDNMIYTNDSEYVEKIEEMLNQMWKEPSLIATLENPVNALFFYLAEYFRTTRGIV